MDKPRRFLCILVRFFFASVFVLLLYHKDDKPDLDTRHAGTLFGGVNTFMKDWCRVRQERVDVYSKLNACNFNISWEARYTEEQQMKLGTDPSKSEISEFQIKPAGEFSRFLIKTRTRDGQWKTFGGDSWRIMLRGPAAMSPTVFDLANGFYEVVFLIIDPGIYELDITLDYSLCDGYRDPPSHWFLIGNSQGKMQPEGSLQGHAKRDYLMKKFQDGRRIMINVPLSSGGGVHLLNSLPELHPSLVPQYDLTCAMKCNWMWDGYGRWIDDEWKPYLSARKHKTSKSGPTLTSSPEYSTLMIYGDSQAARMHKSIENSLLCSRIFKSCVVRKMWVYPYQNEMPPWDDLDFDPDRIIQDIKKQLEKPEMDEKSVFILNLGLHYLQDTNFTSYKELLKGVVEAVRAGRTKRGDGQIKARIIWKTTAAISKEKDTDSLLFSDRKRFLNLPRVELFNTFATKLMCNSGIEVFDVYPLTRGYPKGTGGPDVEFYKEHDIVHYKFYLLKPLDLFLEKYFLGQIPFPISLENYEFH